LYLLAVAIHVISTDFKTCPTSLDKLPILPQSICYQNQLPTVFTITEVGYIDRRMCKTGDPPITGTLERLLKKLTYYFKHSLTTIAIYSCKLPKQG